MEEKSLTVISLLYTLYSIRILKETKARSSGLRLRGPRIGGKLKILKEYMTISKCGTGTLGLAGLFVLCVGVTPNKPPGLWKSYFGKAPVLDGVLSQGEWDDSTVFSGAKEWFPAFHPVTDDKDLSVKGYVKHDAGVAIFRL